MRYHINHIPGKTLSNCDTSLLEPISYTPQPSDDVGDESLLLEPMGEPADPQLLARMKSGANWFYWIAALSLINSVIVLMGSQWNFIIGLGVTQLVDGLALVIAEELGSFAKFFGLGLSLVIAGMVALFGHLAGKGHRWVFLLGMVLYLGDGLLFVMASDWLGAGFHAFVLFNLFSGYQACNQLKQDGVSSEDLISDSQALPV